MKKFLILSTSLATLAFISPVSASGDEVQCGNTNGQWMRLDAAKSKAAELGYEVRRIKREDGCLEIYAINKNGDRVELYMNPVSGEVVKIKNKS